MRWWKFLLPAVTAAILGLPMAAAAQTQTADQASARSVAMSEPAFAGSPVVSHAGSLGKELPVVSVLPFVLLLACIAILPLCAPHWWEHNRHKALVSACVSLPIVLYFLPLWDPVAQHELIDKLQEYVSFIALLGALYVISGGIYIKGSLSGTPLGNSGLLALGAVLASIIGTTGASVLLIRPLLRANRTRQRKAHIVVFFIFIVSNCGGLLTPLGDPPLFLGFLKGVPFEWTLLHLWRQWLFVNGILLLTSHVLDELILAREEKSRAGSQLEEALVHEPIRVLGQLNFLFLLGVMLVIVAKGHNLGAPAGKVWSFGIQEGIMVGLAIGAYLTTRAENRAANRFTFGPILEVAVLFVGIFITMAPALAILNAWGRGDRTVLGLAFGLSQPWEFFWATGSLSGVLDNAPTYLTLAATACGIRDIDTSGSQYLGDFLATGDAAAQLLAAISCGAVFMGANTYIGNGPNFMVKAIAEENGVEMPSFFGYIVYTGAILIPLFILTTWVFFRT